MTTEHSHEHEHGHGHNHERRDPEEISRSPRFEPSTDVILRDAVPERYKRHPDYAEGSEGVIESLHGAYMPPENPNESHSDYEFLYSVWFTHAELFGDDHPESNGRIYIDIWEAALEKA